jgi:hypothetical protein
VFPDLRSEAAGPSMSQLTALAFDRAGCSTCAPASDYRPGACSRERAEVQTWPLNSTEAAMYAGDKRPTSTNLAHSRKRVQNDATMGFAFEAMLAFVEVVTGGPVAKPRDCYQRPVL